jgi:hypothetical protein
VAGVFFVLPYCVIDNQAAEYDTDCGSEGVDNSTMAWTTTFFLAGATAIWAFSLFVKSSRSWSIGLVAFGGFAIAFLFQGIAIKNYGNTGTCGGLLCGVFCGCDVYVSVTQLNLLFFQVLMMDME